MRKISIAIPTFERFQQTVDSFKHVLHDDRVSEVIINDDASMDDSLGKLEWYFKNESKVLIFENDVNQDCFRNKHESVQNASNHWVILLDSDNTITPSYLDALYALPEWNTQTIYQPEWAMPAFDFRKWSGLTITKENVYEYVNTDLMTMMNTSNHFINRFEYLKIWDGSVDPGSSDSIFFSYTWLKAGNKINVTPGLRYDHFIDPNGNGHYQKNSRNYVQFHAELMEKIKAFR